MGRRNPRGGRPRLLDDDSSKRLTAAVAAGAPISAAAAVIGVSPRVVFAWRARGEAEQERRDLAQPPDPHEDVYAEFHQRMTEAQARATVSDVVALRRAIEGGQVIEETTKKYRDDNGEMVEETTIKRTAPDWRAAAWHLERTRRAEFGKDAERLEVTGAGGGPVLTTAADAEDLASRVAANLAALAGATPMRAIEPASEDHAVQGEVVRG